MRYQFQSEYGQHSWKPRLFTEAIKIIIGVNVILFILKSISGDIVSIFGLSPQTVWPHIWQPVSYMFIHGNFWHVGINMLVLWMFGSELEMIWGKQNFLKYYFITGVGSGLIWLLFNFTHPFTVLIGASGAVYGLLLAYGLMFPNRTVYLYFLIPIKIKYLVMILGAVAFMSSFNNTSNISHVTHLSGMVIGYLYLKKSIRWSNISFLMRKKLVEFQSQKKFKNQMETIENQKIIDQILDKINQEGYDNLTDEEVKILFDSSRKISKNKDKN